MTHEQLEETAVSSIHLSSDIYNCHDDSAAQRLEYADIPQDKMKQIRSLHHLRPMHNLMIVFYYSLWAFSAIVILQTDSILLQLVAIYLIGCSIAGLPIMTHEASHQLLSRNKKWNRFLGFVSGLPALMSTTAYYSMHIAHHSDTRTKDDPDNIENSAGPLMPLTLLYYIAFIFGVPAYIPRVAVIGYTHANASRRKDIIIEYGTIVVFWIATFWLVSFHTLLMIWILPLIVTTAISNVRGVAEHGLTTSGNVFTQTRTVRSNAFVRFMMCNLNYHLEHHLFPGVPWYNLPAVHRLLMPEYERAGASVYPSYSAFLIDFLRISVRGVRPNIRMVHASIADKVCS